jgi:hypothetical protein
MTRAWTSTWLAFWLRNEDILLMLNSMHLLERGVEAMLTAKLFILAV